MRRLWPLAFAGVLLGGCRKADFKVSGTITIASNLQRRAPEINSVLFIIAKNRGGIPVAVRRVVNPQFPVSFTLTPEDLIVPQPASGEPLILEVEMNTHGNVGSPVRGDLEGQHPGPVNSGSHVDIVIDRQV